MALGILLCAAGCTTYGSDSPAPSSSVPAANPDADVPPLRDAGDAPIDDAAVGGGALSDASTTPRHLQLADLTDGTLLNAIDLDETGKQVASSNVWTGSNADGSATGASCNGFTTNMSGTVGTAGSNLSATMTWSNDGARSCNSSNRIFCFEQ